MFKKIFKKKETDKMTTLSEYRLPEPTNYNGILDIKFIYMNDHVNTIYPACASCYNISKDKNIDREARLGYIGRRVVVDHTSILEHSNIIIEFKIPNSYLKELTEFLGFCRYLNYKCKKYDEDTTIVLLSGSIRGFRFLIMEIDNQNNVILTMIKQQLSEYIDKEYFIDLIKSNVIEDSFITFEEGVEPFRTLYPVKSKEDDIIDIINFDNFDIIRSRINKIFSIRDILDCISITINFKKMSRVITQQLVRHRNAITQESQRYVKYSGVGFNSPAKYKDKYDLNKKYTTPFGNFTLQELGDKMCEVYEYLVDQGVEKEDARGFLPQNNQSGAVYMTFTLRTLFVFLNLRLDPHAQAEIRHYAEVIYNSIEDTIIKYNIVDEYNLEEIKKYIEPRVLFESNNENSYDLVDEIID